jgi:hypothetical protein
MNRHEAKLDRLLRSFLEGELPFADFHEQFLARWTRLPAGSLPEPVRLRWNEVYAVLLTAVPDPVTPLDAAGGVIGEAELRRRLSLPARR